jgi:hypothetical protein
MRTLMLLIAILLVPTVVEAEKFTTSKNGKEVVAHTRRAPVVMHRALPPYGLGLHVYAGRND